MKRQIGFRTTNRTVILSPPLIRWWAKDLRFFATLRMTAVLPAKRHCFAVLAALNMFTFVVFVVTAVPAWASKDSRNPNDWYERAHEDLEIAELLFKETKYYPVVCFHSHQAVEKALKGALISRGSRPNKTHLTADLAQKLSRYNHKSKIFVNPLRELDKLYVPSRYPKEGQNPFTKEEASFCLEQAKQIFDLAASEFEIASGV